MNLLSQLLRSPFVVVLYKRLGSIWNINQSRNRILQQNTKLNYHTMSFKALVFFGLLAVTLGFTLPEEESSPYLQSEWDQAYIEGAPVVDEDDLILVRRARSPQGSVSGTFEHSRQMGSSASIDYNHQLRRNLEVYGGASRNFRFNDNSGHVGLRYRF